MPAVEPGDGVSKRAGRKDRPCQVPVNSPHRSRPASSAGTPGWPGCADWWIRSRWRARARSAGMRVLSVTGRDSESRLAFAGLHQLLRPVLSGATGLPARQAQALTGALGLSADPVAADPLLTGVAVLTLLSDLSERSPVLVVADDAHWLDRSSLNALAFAASRLDAEPVAVLVGARDQAPPFGFDRGFPELQLGPLSAADAGCLLDAQ